LLFRPVNRGLLSLFLVGTLLLCHGAFGALHQLEERGLVQHHPAAHALADHAAGHQDGGHGISGDEPAGPTNYAAVLVILLLGAAYLLHRRVEKRPAPPAASALVAVRPPAFLPRRARGPTLPLLQMFRL
jgi:hypothetical protein